MSSEQAALNRPEVNDLFSQRIERLRAHREALATQLSATRPFIC